MALETRAVASRGPPRAVVKSVTSETTTQSLNRCCITRVLFSSKPSKTLTTTKNQTRCFSTEQSRRPNPNRSRNARIGPLRNAQLGQRRRRKQYENHGSQQNSPRLVLGTSKVAKADDGFYHVTPDLVSVEKTNIPGKYKVTLVNKQIQLNQTKTFCEAVRSASILL